MRPFKEAVAENSTQYFKFTSSDDGPVEVTLTMISGVVDLAVSFQVETPNDSNPECAKTPSSPNSCFFDNNGRFGLIPQILTTDIAPNKDVYVGVTGVSNAMFTVQARSPGNDTRIHQGV